MILLTHKALIITSILSTSFGHLLTSFCLAFYFKRKNFVLIDQILSETLSVPVLCFQIFTAKLIYWPKVGLTYAISMQLNWIFLIFFIKK